MVHTKRNLQTVFFATEVSEDALRLLRRKGQRVYRFSAL